MNTLANPCSVFLQMLKFRTNQPKCLTLFTLIILLLATEIWYVNFKLLLHLDWNCLSAFTKIVLDSAPYQLLCDWNRYMQGEFTVNRIPKFKEQIAYLFLSVAGHLIWRERNDRIHIQGHRCTPLQIIARVKQMLREKLHTSKQFQMQAARNSSIISALY